MSSRPEVTRENIEDLFRSVLEEEEYFDSLGQLPEVDGEVYDEAARARSALMRSAGVPPGVEFAREVNVGALAVADERLGRFFCDALKASYLLMNALEVPAQARDFVLIVMAASGGRNRRLIMTDERLANFSGYSERTIREKRRLYREWLDSPKGWTAVRIHEQGFDRAAGKTAPTEYEVPFTAAVIKALREWRSYYQQQLNQPQVEDRAPEEPPGLWDDMREERKSVAFAESTRPEVFTEIAGRVISDTLDCELVDKGERRRDLEANRKMQAAREQTAAKVRRDDLAASEAQLLSLIARARDAARRKGQGAYSWWADFKRKAAIVLAERTPGFPDPEEE